MVARKLPHAKLQRESFFEGAATMRRVLLESPYKGVDWSETEENIRYARACMHDCFLRGEAPFASALLYTQEGVLNDKVPEERRLGIEAGLLWGECAEVSAVYVDRGIPDGVKKGIRRAIRIGRPREYRSLYGNSLPDEKFETELMQPALFESVVTDQGNGGSYCDGCKHTIDFTAITALGYCPHCERPLVWGEMHIPQGGSDF